MEFDHLFICVEAPANEADILTGFGLTEGAPNHHPGQGTANRRFFFNNAFIELLFVTDSDEISSELTAPTQLHERFASQAQSASPFGVCFRPSGTPQKTPFKSVRYQPRYLPKELCVEVGDSPVSEPMWFYLAFGSRPDKSPADKRQPATHECGFEEITSVKITSPLAKKLSEPASAANNVSGVEFRTGDEHLLQIGFDHEVKGDMKDFRPALPLVFRW